MDDKRSELELIEAVISGEVDDYVHLVKRYESMVFNLAVRMLQNFVEAQDVCQEVFLKIYQNLKKYDSGFAFKDWIYRVTVNLTNDKLRKRKWQFLSLDKKVETDDGEVIWALQEEGSDPAVKFAVKDEQLVVQKFVDTLPLKYRVMIVLRHWEGLKYEEIAKILNMPVGTAKTRVIRAQDKLYKKMKLFYREKRNDK
ncbi:MAG: sigma-70 family RNA polymerase sigma factor [Elusimicrobiota bacterium]